ncbi:MAG TPA: type II secretion system protein N [Noviherbaspirillum sp.]|nr:type II secretion system protein N [Noviherbaspirillum sp.]
MLFIALCASIAYWGLQLFKPPTRPVAAPPRMARAEVSPDDAAALFGGRAGKVAVASNYQLKGIILSGTSGDSIAILSADGKPAQAIAAGAEVVPGVTVKEVHRDYVLLSEGGATKRVELPENAKLQVSLASAAPVGPQGGAASQPARTQPPAPVPSSQPAQAAQTPVPGTASGQAGQTPARSPLLPPPAPPGAQQAQPQSQTGAAIPPRVVVSPPPSAQTQTAVPAPTPTQPQTAPAPAAATTAPAISPQPGVPPIPASSGSSSGEMLPPPALQSR